jgi:hypothetical protein
VDHATVLTVQSKGNTCDEDENGLQWILKVLAGKLDRLTGRQINFWEAGAYCRWARFRVATGRSALVPR